MVPYIVTICVSFTIATRESEVNRRLHYAADKAAVKRAKHPLTIKDRNGLWEVDAQGKIRQVFKGTDWMKQ